jgi:hypothetical protein
MPVGKKPSIVLQPSTICRTRPPVNRPGSSATSQHAPHGYSFERTSAICP